MTVYRQHRHTRYTVVPNDALERADLSWKAKGLLAYLLSRPDNWEARADQLATVSTDGRRAVLAARKELVDAGYLVEQRCRNAAGHLHTVTHVFDTPGHTASELPCRDATDSDDTGVPKPHPGPSGTGVRFTGVAKPHPITTTEQATTEKDLKESGEVRPSGRTPKEPAGRKERRRSSSPRAPHSLRSKPPPPKDHSAEAWQLARDLFAALSERDLVRINALPDVEHEWVVRDVLDAWEGELSCHSYDDLDAVWFAHDPVDGAVEFDVYRWAGIGKADNIGAVLAWRIRNPDDAQWDGRGESCYLEPYDDKRKAPPT